MSLAQVYEQEYMKKQTVDNLALCFDRLRIVVFSRMIKAKRKINDMRTSVKWCKIYSLISMLYPISDSHRNQ